MNNIPYLHLLPENCYSLRKVRIGQNGDGGYIIPQEILKDIEEVITFGVNDEDSFEIHLSSSLGRKVPFTLCDPFCGYTARPGNEEFLFKSLGLGKETKEDEKMISWPEFRRTFLQTKEKGEGIFLKVDIEYAEWDSFECLQAADFEGVEILVIEFHSLLSKFEDREKQCKVLKTLCDLFHLYHLHANNNGYLFTNEILGYLPDVVECTFISKKWAAKHGHTFVKRVQPYPEELDQPCHPIKVDPMIHWWHSINFQQ